MAVINSSVFYDLEADPLEGLGAKIATEYYRWSLPPRNFVEIEADYRSLTAGVRMFVQRPNRSKLFLCLVVSPLLCGIALVEFPQLITLTADTTTDFTISAASSGVPSAPRSQQAASVVSVEFTAPLSAIHVSPYWRVDGFKPPSSDLLVLHSVLQT